VKLFLRHAVGTAKIAAIHDGNTQIVQGPPETVERIVRAAYVVNGLLEHNLGQA
jgi:hypothetical protein